MINGQHRFKRSWNCIFIQLRSSGTRLTEQSHLSQFFLTSVHVTDYVRVFNDYKQSKDNLLNDTRTWAILSFFLMRPPSERRTKNDLE